MAMPFKEKALVAGFALVAVLTCAGLTKVTVNLLNHKQPWLYTLLNRRSSYNIPPAPTSAGPPRAQAPKKSAFETACDNIAASAQKSAVLKAKIREKEEAAYRRKLHAYEKAAKAARADKTGKTKIPRKPIRQAELYRKNAENAMRIALDKGRWETTKEICRVYQISPLKAAVIVIQESFFGEDTETPLSSAGGAFQHKGKVGWERLVQYGAEFVKKARTQIDCKLCGIDKAFLDEVETLRKLIVVTPSRTSNSSSYEPNIEAYRALLAKETKGGDQSWRKKTDAELKAELSARIDALRNHYAYSTALFAAYDRDNKQSAESVLGKTAAKALQKMGLDFEKMFPDAGHYAHVWGKSGGNALMRNCILHADKTMFATLRRFYGSDAETIKAITNNKADPNETVAEFFYGQQKQWREQYETLARINARLEQEGAPFRVTTKAPPSSGKITQAMAPPMPDG